MKVYKSLFKTKQGFTLIELVVVVAIIGILAALAVPTIKNWLPNYRLKKAARELYSNMQRAKLTAIKNNSTCAVVFDTTVSPGRYYICSDPGSDNTWNGPPSMGGDDTAINSADLGSYGSEIDFGFADATKNLKDAGALPVKKISYSSVDPATTPPCAAFTSRGMSDTTAQVVTEGYVYIQNNSSLPKEERNTFGVGGLSSGVIRLQKWYSNPGSWD